MQEAEEHGWVHDIDLWMIQESSLRWFTRFAEHGITRINVNLSPQTAWWKLSGSEISRCLDAVRTPAREDLAGDDGTREVGG